VLNARAGGVSKVYQLELQGNPPRTLKCRHDRKKKCFPDKMNNTQKVLSKYLLIDVLISKPQTSKVMGNMPCGVKCSQEKM
jgi:hypothetical protein